MILFETENEQLINAVLKHPEIYASITDDDSPCAEHFIAPISDKYRYVVGTVFGEIVGLMVYHEHNDGEMCHVQVLPEHRKEHAKEFGEQSLKYKRTPLLYAEIPDYYHNVLAFAVLNGFEVYGQEGVYIKDGVQYPINLLKYKG